MPVVTLEVLQVVIISKESNEIDIPSIDLICAFDDIPVMECAILPAYNKCSYLGSLLFLSPISVYSVNFGVFRAFAS